MKYKSPDNIIYSKVKAKSKNDKDRVNIVSLGSDDGIVFWLEGIAAEAYVNLAEGKSLTTIASEINLENKQVSDNLKFLDKLVADLMDNGILEEISE